MKQIMEDYEASPKGVISKRAFTVVKLLYLNETKSPMRPGQVGFAYVAPGSVVRIEFEPFEYTVGRENFESAIQWK